VHIVVIAASGSALEKRRGGVSSFYFFFFLLFFQKTKRKIIKSHLLHVSPFFQNKVTDHGVYGALPGEPTPRGGQETGSPTVDIP